MSNYEDNTTARLERIRAEVTGKKNYSSNPRLPDEYDMKAHTADVIRGRDRDAMFKWRRVMEQHGFTWFSPEALTKCFGPQKVVPKEFGKAAGHFYMLRPHTVGMWRRHSKPGSKKESALWSKAFTIHDLISLFGEPRKFAEWIRAKDKMAELQEKGYKVMPVELRKPRYKDASPNTVNVQDSLTIVNETKQEGPRARQTPKKV